VIKENILDAAKEKAYAEAAKIVQEARQQIVNEKEQAMLEVRKHMVDLTVEMTEKVLRRNLEKKQDQSELIRQLLKDVESSQS
jgi:F-type H+-transporting ATPase subunit b